MITDIIFIIVGCFLVVISVIGLFNLESFSVYFTNFSKKRATFGNYTPQKWNKFVLRIWFILGMPIGAGFVYAAGKELISKI